ncbi:MAG: L-threonylcarbamoyladenylate synthase [Planctomycetota bacterium]
METERLQADDHGDLARAAALLRDGRIVAFPTETVYGLGARAGDAEALARLRHVKNRPEGKKFALLLAFPEWMAKWGDPDSRAEALAEAFWPGPLTLVVPDGAGGDVGLRCPDLESTREMLRLSGAAVAAPSANPAGQPPARDADQVLGYFEGRIAALVDGGPVELGVASTVVRLTGPELEVIRRGALPEQKIRRLLQSHGLL